MTYKMVLISTLACAGALVVGPVANAAVADSLAKMRTERAPGVQGAELTELLSAHGIPPAHELAGEITREVIAGQGAAATVALCRPPVLHPPADTQVRAATARAGDPPAPEPARAIAPLESPSPLRSALRKVLRLLKLLK